MINYDYTITNRSGDSFIINGGPTLAADPANFYALQTYPTFDDSVKNNEVARVGQHGIWDFESYYGRKNIVMEGIIVGEDKQNLERLKAAMNRVLRLPYQYDATEDGYVTIEWTDEDAVDKMVEAKIVQSPRFDRDLQNDCKMRFFINLKAKENFIETGGPAIIDAGIRGWDDPGGFFIDWEFDIEWTPTKQNVLSVTNGGDLDSHTIIRLYGEAQQPITVPSIYNLTTGKGFRLNYILSNETNFIEIDSKLGTVKNDAGVDISGFVIPGSTPITLTVGVNLMYYESNEDPLVVLLTPDAVFEVEHRDTYAS